MKTQMKFQKILVLLTLIIAGLSFVYALAFMTSLSALYNYTSVNNDGLEMITGVDDVYNYALEINDVFFYLSIVFILLAAVLYITASNRRRNYYVTNYISVIAVAVFALVFAAVGIAQLSACIGKYYAMDYVGYYDMTHTWYILGGDPVVADSSPGEGYYRIATYYSDPTLFFVLGYVCYVLVLAVAAAHVLNLIWKMKLMKGEKALLSAGLVKEVA